MGTCSSSSSSASAPIPPTTKSHPALAQAVSGAASDPNRKSLSNYNKTKGGSMLINVSQHFGDDTIEFIDDQHIMSPAKAEWKVGKSIKRAPDMKETATIPVAIPGGGFLKTEVGYKTLQGKNPRPPHKPNQDALSIFVVDGHPNLVVYACFDGHGPYGEHASNFCRSRLHPSMLARGDQLNTNPKQALIDALAEVHSAFCSEETAKAGVDPIVSGTTCVAVLFDGKTMHVANVGDSRAIIGVMDNEKHELKTTELTDDHKPQRPDEKARLEKSSALLLTEREVRGFGDESKIYICRERGGDIVYGVLFTRSLGDLDAHNHLGVSALPEMTERIISENDRYIIIASDGVWDYMTNEEVMAFCTQFSDPLKAAEALVAEASNRWETRDADHRRDDITAIILKLGIVEAAAVSAVTNPADET